MPHVQTSHLTITYGSVVALRDVSWQANAGEQWWIVGPNGGGKSSLLYAIVGLQKPATGSAGVDGQVAYVAQRDTINWRFPARVRDVVALGCTKGPWWWPHKSSDHADRVTACLDRVGLIAMADRRLTELSGGQQQRVVLARALASESDIFLFDEPAKGLDRVSEDVIGEVAAELAAAGKVVVTVTHDLVRVSQSGGSFLGIAGGEVARGPASRVLDGNVLASLFGRVHSA